MQSKETLRDAKQKGNYHGFQSDKTSTLTAGSECCGILGEINYEPFLEFIDFTSSNEKR